MKKEQYFLGQKCQITFLDGFVLYGIVEEADEYGILFTTKQKTSFINWSKLSDIKVIDDEE